MKKSYEILFIIKPNLAEDVTEEILKSFQGWVTNNEGEILLFKPWGLKELATVFDKMTHGYYVQCQFKGTNKTLTEIKNRFAVSETVFRNLVVTLDSVQSDKPVEERKPPRKIVTTATPSTEE